MDKRKLFKATSGSLGSLAISKAIKPADITEDIRLYKLDNNFSYEKVFELIKFNDGCTTEFPMDLLINGPNDQTSYVCEKYNSPIRVIESDFVLVPTYDVCFEGETLDKIVEDAENKINGDAANLLLTTAKQYEVFQGTKESLENTFLLLQYNPFMFTYGNYLISVQNRQDHFVMPVRIEPTVFENYFCSGGWGFVEYGLGILDVKKDTVRCVMIK